ncbi:hypothetical protein DSL72_009429 [Monilinia vaccinii-corymbosi]|uniref:Uncharacterized protein n=1 Tax=Monilinia vaccinii-corymbosi TaxID=61207 RepID=A0A8A3PR56_9HELO|nr:hypothetical protein DSL72_009429 [Monilinia vaccinii-corymbosi]
MFGNRRRRATSNPPSNANVSASAATAAAQALLSSRASSTSLSSAAAAAALRSRPTTPTSVADVQTKRTLRRNASTSSAGSSAGGSVRGPPGYALVRRGSSASMTERTFRDSSPSRSSPVPSAYDAPPVPAIPKNIKAGGESSRRSASMDAPGLRVASPPPTKPGGRGSSLGPSATQSRGMGSRNLSSSSVSEVNGEKRGSVNFSYPTSTRPISPEGQRRLTCHQNSSVNPRIVSPNNQNLVYDPNTRRFLPLADILAIEQSLDGIANAPVKRKKRTPTAQGTHLAAGTVGGRIRGTAVDAMENVSKQNPTEQQYISQPAPQPTSQPIDIPAESSQGHSEVIPVSESRTQPEPPAVTTPPNKKKKRVMIPDSDSDQTSVLPDSSADESDVPSQPHAYKTRAGGMLAKKPSVVREDREREEEEEDDSPLRPGKAGLSVNHDEPARTISPSPIPRSSAGRGHGRAASLASHAQEPQHTRSARASVASLSTPSMNGESPPRGGRMQSVSPARAPHFMTNPEILMIRHQPPSRSVSPRKSALKHSSMSSGEIIEAPPSDGASLRPSEMSNDEEQQPRKKANRVSFDDGRNVILGQPATIASNSPAVPSPQTKRSWFGIGRGKKKQIPTADEDDEVMKPRPALPSFGSVRERKTNRETEERPLVKPLEPGGAVAPIISPAPPMLTSHMGDALEYPMGQSNDHAAGAVLAKDAGSKNAANISKSREPLPSDVAPVEGRGELSDASSTYSVDNNNIGIARSNSVKVGPEDGHVDTYRALASPMRDQFENYPGKEDIPEISVQVPTPNAEDTKSREWLAMPGGFQNSGSSSSSEAGDQAKDDTFPPAPENGVVGPTATTQRQNSMTDHSNFPEIEEATQQSSESHPPPILEETEESEGDSIYSDAAEEFEDADDGGFMSLDAVVESPVLQPAVIASDAQTRDSPTSRFTKEGAYMSSQMPKKSSEPEPNEGWEVAQQYWKNLSVDRKKQLELEAQKGVDAEAGSESDEEVKPAPKPKKTKKKTARRKPPTSTMVAMQDSSLPIQNEPHTERSYMVRSGSKADPTGHAKTTMRSSMRAEPPHAESDVHMRKSMRGPNRDGTAQSNGTLPKKQKRPISFTAPEVRANPQAVNQQLRIIQGAADTATSPSVSQRNSRIVAPAPAPALLRRKSSGDSDTSFKRARPATDGISMRRSMRRGSETSANGRQQSPMSSSRFSLRSASPGGPPTVTMRGTMRNSMRGSNDSTARAKSPIRIPGFGRSSSARPAPKQKSMLSRGSRFADSSDEDEPRPGFRSRFVDSSDEDEPTSMPIVARPMPSRGTPVRSIPQPAGYQDGDSSDLPDSDDDLPPTAKSLKRSPQNDNRPASRNTGLASGNLQRSGSGRGMLKGAHAQGTISNAPIGPAHARHGSILSVFRKKPDSNSKVRKYNGESTARKDTLLERNRSDLEAIKRQESFGKSSSPKLQKRNPYATVQNSGSWPLTNEEDDIGIKIPVREGKPISADAGNGTVGGESKDVDSDVRSDIRSDFGSRRFAATGLSDVDVMGKGSPRKKKRFQVLRKMFKLDD